MQNDAYRQEPWSYAVTYRKEDGGVPTLYMYDCTQEEMIEWVRAYTKQYPEIVILEIAKYKGGTSTCDLKTSI